MNTLFLVTALLFNFTPQDGSLIFIENGNRVVQSVTNSTVSHVAIIFKENDEFVVYEAEPPEVRKITLTEYYKEIEKLNKKKRKLHRQRRIWIANPDTPLTDEQKTTALKYLKSQLGKKYSVSSYISSQQQDDSIHCCELVGETLKSIGINYTKQSWTDSPFDVWVKTKPFYSKRERITYPSSK